MTLEQHSQSECKADQCCEDGQVTLGRACQQRESDKAKRKVPCQRSVCFGEEKDDGNENENENGDGTGTRTYPKHDIQIGNDRFWRTLGDFRHNRGSLPRCTKRHLVAIRTFVGEDVVQLYRSSTDNDMGEEHGWIDSAGVK